MSTTAYYSAHAQAKAEHALTDPGFQRPPFRARCYNVVAISAVTETGIVRAIGYGWGPHTLDHYRPFVEAILREVGTPGIAARPEPIEWTGYVYGIPHYVMTRAIREAIPRGIYLFRRVERPVTTYDNGWSFCFEESGEYLAPLPTGW